MAMYLNVKLFRGKRRIKMVVITDLTTVFWTIVFGNLVMVGLMLLVISSTANQILDEIRGLKNQIIQVYETDD